MLFKLSIIIEDEDRNPIDAFNLDSSTALEAKLEKLQQQHLVIQQEWLHVVTLTVKVPPHENKALKALGPEAFEDLSDEMPALVSSEEAPVEICEEEIYEIPDEIDYDSTES